MSELGVYLAEHEGWARREAARRERLAHEAAAHGHGRSLAARFMHRIRQFVDPRGYALAEMRPSVAVEAPVETLPATGAPVARLEIVERPIGAREPRQAA